MVCCWNFYNFTLIMAEIYQKTIDDKCIILSPREALMREMNIPSNWTLLDVIVGLSFTSTSSPNAEPAEEETVSRLSNRDSFFFGVKDGTLEQPGFAGRFLGFSTAVAGMTTRTNGIGTYTRTIMGPGVYSPLATAADAATVVTSPSLVDCTDTYFCMPNDPTPSTGYFRWVAIRLDRSSGTSLVAAVSPSGNLTDASNEALRSHLIAATWGYVSAVAVSGISTWDVRHLFLRFPFYNYRIRVHNYGYRLIS